jgi:hypothetical protein
MFSRTLLLLATVFTFGYTRAEVVGDGSVITPSQAALERSLDRALNRHLSFPVLAKGDMTGEVLVGFVINKEGRIEVLSCDSENEALKAYVLRKLARIDIGENPEGIWKTTYLKISFKPEKKA